jgi:hypothetical protein
VAENDESGGSWRRCESASTLTQASPPPSSLLSICLWSMGHWIFHAGEAGAYENDEDDAEVGQLQHRARRRVVCGLRPHAHSSGSPPSVVHVFGSITLRRPLPFIDHPGLNPHCRSHEQEGRQSVCRSIRNTSSPPCLLGNFYLPHLPSCTSQIKLISFDLGIKMQVHMLICFHPLDNQLVCASRCVFLMLFKCGEYEPFLDKILTSEPKSIFLLLYFG